MYPANTESELKGFRKKRTKDVGIHFLEINVQQNTYFAQRNSELYDILEFLQSRFDCDLCALLLGGKIFNKKWPHHCCSAQCWGASYCYISLIRFSIRSCGTAVSHITGCDSIIFVHHCVCEQTKWHLSLMHRSSLQFPQFLSWNLATWRSIKEWPSLR